MRTLFPQNINKAGRILRFSIGMILLGVGIWRANWIYITLSLFCFFEAYMSWCAFYHLIGFKDRGCKKK